MKEHRYFVYMMSNYSHTVLYTGMTGDLFQRVHQHKYPDPSAPPDRGIGYAQRYNANHLVYYEETSDVKAALAREKQLKGWKRNRKDNLVAALNPTWDDLSST
jgi:putative endonuclease